ncbi:3-oxoacyl-[acyl-carrier-protein] synthase-1 [Pseudomonas sp. NFACC09-4]|uniref:beta-ketoacyl synthase N-terminal-like domain-containing protein n=1 Tax=Pseudomonas sp. NFACC09-4 TaxID=1566237 RepID=UPI000908F3C7|nr:beta-ketoacyl synthase N-terminal-like domain-containing protein [Pseudomonas sp. NFACC09-4]SFW48366.1 3-oxoacyl-[acyl-carrier-protein] synthase-1 [Pseudomonas sp. NFACC09-4]
MSALCIIGSGMVSAVGLSAPASCAAIRCAIDNFQETRFIDRGGEWLIAAGVMLEQPWRGRAKLIKMAARAIAEALQSAPGIDPQQTPLLLGLAEAERPGRLDGLDNSLLQAIEAELGLRFHPDSCIIARGRVSGAVALLDARTLIYQGGHRYVLVAGVDSFLAAPTLDAFEDRQRLLTSQNSNGFIPGEGAAAVVLTPPVASTEPQLTCIGLGFGMEKATVEAEDMPLRAEGLSQAIRAALGEAGCGLEQMDYRLTDISGEQYYFKEASLALGRTLRVRKEHFHLWHPADCIGEVGAAIGPAMLAVALAASRKGYGDGPNIFCHLGNDAGERAVALLSYQTTRAA